MKGELSIFSLKERVIILTGGAGSYGRTLAAAIAGAGAKLILASRNESALEEVAVQERAHGHDVHALSFDQGDADSINRLCESVIGRHGKIDGLVNNAVFRPAKTLTASDPAGAWMESLRVNALGLYLLTRNVGERMAGGGGGSIVNVGSIYGMLGPSLSFYEGTGMKTGLGDYYFNKGGMLNLTRYFAALYGPSGVRVNCVSPGGFKNQQPSPFIERYERETFLARMAGPDDLGGPVVFLLSDAAGYVTGANLPVDGGFSAH